MAGTAGEAGEVFRFLLENGKYSAPCWPSLSPRKVYTGKVDFLEPLNDPIVRLVDPVGMRIINVTLPKHILFPGWVEVQVNARAGATWIDVSGYGRGNFASANQALGPLIFHYLISKVASARAKASGK